MTERSDGTIGVARIRELANDVIAEARVPGAARGAGPEWGAARLHDAIVEEVLAGTGMPVAAAQGRPNARRASEDIGRVLTDARDCTACASGGFFCEVHYDELEDAEHRLEAASGPRVPGTGADVAARRLDEFA